MNIDEFHAMLRAGADSRLVGLSARLATFDPSVADLMQQWVDNCGVDSQASQMCEQALWSAIRHYAQFIPELQLQMVDPT